MKISNLFRGKRGKAAESPELKVVFRHGEDGFIVAECPQLPGCMSQGRTKQEAMENIVDAIRSVLEVRIGQFVGPPRADGSGDPIDDGEETFRIKGPELISV
jgi:predicted RNase H-like HicB family nuclease